MFYCFEGGGFGRYFVWGKMVSFRVWFGGWWVIILGVFYIKLRKL